ncbi:hypothetical protein BJ878DRAFT_513478 [Calycina marina]|uniref:Uncharacterized protein n=1 Tax=Calycina marina TaxID=1763456 RepID=A0A9P8CDQ0_9HELO|nr:hypothetical protein BJ878DRAFT_513478 [Calycina marina]
MTPESTASASQLVVTSFPLNPLTVSFSPPADCSAIYESTVFMVAPTTTCLPPSAGLASSQFFSPGTACPTGYWNACHDTTGVTSITTVTCCPIVSDLTMSCARTRLSKVWSTLFCTWAPTESTWVQVTLSDDGGQTSTSSVNFISPAGLNAFGVRMLYESTDVLTTTTSSSMSIKSNPTSLPTSTSIPPSTSFTATATSRAAAGLSTGAKAAIGVVIPLASFAILGSLFFWWRRKRSNAKTADYQIDQVTPAAAFQLPYQDKKTYTPIELSEDGGRSELPSGAYTRFREDEPVELPATNIGGEERSHAYGITATEEVARYDR